MRTLHAVLDSRRRVRFFKIPVQAWTQQVFEEISSHAACTAECPSWSSADSKCTRRRANQLYAKAQRSRIRLSQLVLLINIGTSAYQGMMGRLDVASPSKSESGGMRGGLQNDRLLVAALLECAQQKAQLLCNHQSDGDGVARSGFSWKFRAWCSAWPRSVLGNACTAWDSFRIA